MARRRRFSEDSFGPTIEVLMAEAGVTYRELAARTGLSAGYLNHLVHGNRPVPSNDVVRTLSDALGQAGINLHFLMALVSGRRYAAVFGFGSEADADRAVSIIKKSAAAKPATTARSWRGGSPAPRTSPALSMLQFLDTTWPPPTWPCSCAPTAAARPRARRSTAWPMACR